jgi:replicative DNA helicase
MVRQYLIHFMRTRVHAAGADESNARVLTDAAKRQMRKLQRAIVHAQQATTAHAQQMIPPAHACEQQQ